MRRRDRLQIDATAVEDVRSTFAALFEDGAPCVDVNDRAAFGVWLRTFYDTCDRASALDLDWLQLAQQ